MKRFAIPIRALRKYVSWVFALSFLLGLPITFSTTLNIFDSIRQRDARVHLSFAWWLILFLLPWIMPLQVIAFGMAWWTVFREKQSARSWGIAASLVFIAWAVLPLLLRPHFFWKGDMLILGIGIVGLIAFVRPIEVPSANLQTQLLSIPGDRTSSFINKGMQLFALLAYLAAYNWWLRWLTRNDFSPPPFITGTLTLAAVGITIVTLHESGHALVGFILGMKLRAFLVGPFQWRVRDGKWSFDFDPKQILVTAGATGVVPTSPDFPRWRQLCMLVAGVLINVFTGCIALWFAYTGAAPGRGDLLALFGAFSLVAGAMNLVPFRLPDNYSDGAQIYQVLSGGAWADFHRAVVLAGASLVTPLRPRDYDIEAIQRAAQTIAQGRQGLLLRLFAYSYFLDEGNLNAAGEELAQAGSIYNASAADAPAEFLSCFVFSSAYIWRNAELARQWWAHFEAKQPAHNSDFWISYSALQWVEGDLNQASESMEKATALAQALPPAGAYEFQRHCCSLLREAIKRVPVNPQVAVHR